LQIFTVLYKDARTDSSLVLALHEVSFAEVLNRLILDLDSVLLSNFTIGFSVEDTLISDIRKGVSFWMIQGSNH